MLGKELIKEVFFLFLSNFSIDYLSFLLYPFTDKIYVMLHGGVLHRTYSFLNLISNNYNNLKTNIRMLLAIRPDFIRVHKLRRRW